MISRQMQKAGQSAGRKTAIREERLPSGIPYPRPTRDIPASNNSHSIVHEEFFGANSERRIMDREAEQHQYEKQANIVYTRQFKILAKMLGKQNMEFDQLRERVQILLQKERSEGYEQELKLKINSLERQLVKRENQKSPQFANSQNQYTRVMEMQLDRKSKLINELSESIKRQDFQSAYRGLEREVSQKEKTLRSIEDQLQEVRVKSTSQITVLQEEIIKRNQSIQKLTFELDCLKRKHQGVVEQSERLRKREKDLLGSLQTETRLSYQGITYSLGSLLIQLQSRDKELQQCLQLNRQYEEQLNKAHGTIKSLQIQTHSFKNSIYQKEAHIASYKELTDKLSVQLQQFREENDELKEERSIFQKKVENNGSIIQQLQLEKRFKINQLQALQQLIAQNQHYKLKNQEIQEKYSINLQKNQRLEFILKEEKDSHGSTLINFETIQEKMLQQTLARHRLEQLIAQKQQNIAKILFDYELSVKQKERSQTLFKGQMAKLNQKYEQNLIMLEAIKNKISENEQWLQSQKIQKNQLSELNRTLYFETNQLKHVIQVQSEQLSAIKKSLLASKDYEKKCKSLELQMEQTKIQTQANQMALKMKINQQNNQLIKYDQKIQQFIQKQRILSSNQSQNQLKIKELVIQQEKISSLELENELKVRQNASKGQRISSLEHENGLKFRQIASKGQRISCLYSQTRLKVNQLASKQQKISSSLNQTQSKSVLALDVEQLTVKLALSAQQASQKSQMISCLELQIQKYKMFFGEVLFLRKKVQQQESQLKNFHNEIEQKKQKWSILQKEALETTQKLNYCHQQISNYIRMVQTLESRLQQYKTLEEQYVQLRNRHEQQSSQIIFRNQPNSLQQLKHRVVTLQNQLDSSCQQANQLKAIIQELTQRETHLEANNQAFSKEIDQLRIDLQCQRTSNHNQRQQNCQKLQILNQNYHHQRQKLDKELSLRDDMEKQLNILHKTIKNLQEQLQLWERQSSKWKQQSLMLEAQANNYKNDLQFERKSQGEEKALLKTQIQTLIMQNQQAQLHRKVKSQQLQSRNAEATEENQLVLQQLRDRVQVLAEEKQELASIVSELRLEREKYVSTQTFARQQKNQLDHYQFNYYQKGHEVRQEDEYNQRQELVYRVEELQKMVDDLRAQLQQKSNNSLAYSKSQGQQSLKLIINSLQVQKEEVQHAMKELKSQALLKLQLQNSQLRERLQKLVVNQHEARFHALSQKLLKMQQQMARIKREQREQLQKFSHLESTHKGQIQRLKIQLSQAKSKQMQLNNQLLDIEILRGEINVLNEQISAFKKQYQEKRFIIRELQAKNVLLQVKNRELQSAFKEQAQQQRKRKVQNKNQSQVSKKSHSQSNLQIKNMQKQHQKQPSSDGQLSQKILNYDPSKISGQQSKFANLVFQNSKIQIVRQPNLANQGHIQIKQNRNQEPIQSKNLHQSNQTGAKRCSQSQKRQAPKISEQSIAVGKEEIKNEPRDSASSFSSRKSSPSIIHRMKKSNHSIKAVQSDEKQIELLEVKGEPKKEEYLPQQSCRRTITSHLRQAQNQLPKKSPQQSKPFLNKKIHINSVSPIYVARQAIVQGRHDASREQNSKSRSSSKNKVTITYGQPSDKSLEMKKSEGSKLKQSSHSRKLLGQQAKQPQKMQFSMKGSHFGYQMPLEHPINQISPVNARQPRQMQEQTPQTLMGSSREKASQLRVNQMRASIHKDNPMQSESIINGVINCPSSSTLPQVAGNFQPATLKPNQLYYGYRMDNSSKIGMSQQQIANGYNSPFTPCHSAVYLHNTKSSNPLTSIAQSPTNFINPAPPSQLTKNVSFLKQEQKVLIPATAEKKMAQFTPIKVNMKKLPNGLKNTSGYNETATFGVGSNRTQSDSLSITEDSGIDILQYDWVAPCCQNQA